MIGIWMGVPDHQGVIHTGGRIGAAQGPEAFRRIYGRMTAPAPYSKLIDRGDVHSLGSLVQENHQKTTEQLSEQLKDADFSVVVGGGHDHGFSHLCAIRNILPKKNSLGCINIDAHLDVRPATPHITSGSPFYLALESGILEPQHLIEFGIQSSCNSSHLWDYVKQKGVEVYPYESMRDSNILLRHFEVALNTLSQKVDHIVLSFDLDACSAAFCPGVSAPQGDGLTSSLAMECVERAAANPKVMSLGIFELNPELDQDDRTARVAALLAHHFSRVKFSMASTD